MTVGNTVAVTVNIANMAMLEAAKNDCEGLDQVNQARRKDVAGRTKDKRLMGAGEQEKTTISSCKIEPKGAGGTQVASAHSSIKTHEFFPAEFQKGGTSEVRTGQQSVLCGKNNVKHAPPYMQKSGHAEARIMDELVAGSESSKLTLNIDWRKGNGSKSKMPCEDCHKLLCQAIACGHEITLCDKKNQSQPMTEEHCPADASSYQQLQETMGEI